MKLDPEKHLYALTKGLRRNGHKAQIEFRRDDNGVLSGQLTFNGHSLTALVEELECDCCDGIRHRCNLSFCFPWIELPTTLNAMFDAINSAPVALGTEIREGRLLIGGAVTSFPLTGLLTPYEFSRICFEAVINGQVLRSNLCAILGEHAAQSFLALTSASGLPEKHVCHFARWANISDPTREKQSTEPTMSCGEEFFLQLYPGAKPKDASAWWHKWNINHDHWHNFSFVQAFVRAIHLRHKKAA